MNKINRRTFGLLSTGALLTTAARSLIAAPSITNTAGVVRVQGSNYLWEYTQAEDKFRILDSQHRPVVNGKMQPAIVTAPASQSSQRTCSPGKPQMPIIEAGKVTISYENVNHVGQSHITWRFDEQGIWIEPILYNSPAAEDIISLHYFADSDGTTHKPLLASSFLVVPGVMSGSTVSPILHNATHLDQSVWLGRGSFIPGLAQQWALPVHYFCGFSTTSSGVERNLYTEGKSDAFTCGLADLPAGDLFLQIYEGYASPWIDYRSDLWKHMQTPGQLSLGATMLWTVAPDYYGSIAAYYEGLLHAGVIKAKQNSERKNKVALTPQFCTWGAQLVRNKVNEKLDEAFLSDIYKELKNSGMKAGLFSIDDKWEAAYGNLEHSAERLPHFEQFLDGLRADGMFIGMWAAIMRCERPADLGLTEDNMLQKPDGTPYLSIGFGNTKYYILDFTQPKVEQVLTDVIRKFMRRYKPDLFKFDFGYELPAIGTAAPHDKRWTGERMLSRGLEVVIKAMRAENKDIVVMYYNLSPLFLDYFDLHSPDDLWMDIGDYDVEANRRFYFSSLMGKLGVPTYGSSGYDWSSSPSIWFDSAAIGTIGSLNDFGGDEQGETSTPDLIAKYNGIAKVVRSSSNFEIVPMGTVQYAPTLGAHARSWGRFEDGQLVLLAYRPEVPGEGTLLKDASAKDARLKNAVRSAVPVIVASKTSEGISRSSSLAIVSYGGAEIVIRREIGKHAAITNHYFGGTTSKSDGVIVSGELRVTVAVHPTAGMPLEWIEVHVS